MATIPTMAVKYRSNGKKVVINQSDFDSSLHIKWVEGMEEGIEKVDAPADLKAPKAPLDPKAPSKPGEEKGPDGRVKLQHGT